jgi:hypothetical protein
LRSEGFISKRDIPAPGAGLKSEYRWLGGRASIARGGPKNRRKPIANYNQIIVPDHSEKPKEKALFAGV